MTAPLSSSSEPVLPQLTSPTRAPATGETARKLSPLQL
jgi:hypothetical protein